MLFSDLRYDFVRTWFTRLDTAPFDEIERIYDELEDEGRQAISNTSITPDAVTVKRAADMRYVGQEHAVSVDLPLELFPRQDRAGIKRHFDATHELRYGTCAPDERAEIVSLRTTVTGSMRKPTPRTIAAGGGASAAAAFTGRRRVYFAESGGFVETPTYGRTALVAGNRLQGPALVEEHASTTVLPPGHTLEVDAFGNLVIAVAGRR
jgi:N-methylhydantoinase A